MGKKSGHCKFNELRRALNFGVQLFEGYPHRRHRKNGHRKKTQRSKIIEKIKQDEFNKELKNLDKHSNKNL